jgi:hypothetical protein
MARTAASVRIAFLAVVAALAAAAPAAGRPGPVRFSLLPRQAAQGAAVSVSVAAPAGVRCALVVHYRDGAAVGLGTVPAVGGRASWRWTVPVDAKPGRAQVVASCGSAGRVVRTLVVVGTVVAPKITVAKQGYSIRPSGLGSGSSVSYGLMLVNDSQTEDALNVSVLVNFVEPSGHLFGSASTIIPAIGAGQTYALGDSLTFPGAAPVVRLEPVIQVGAHAKASQRYPQVANAHVEPSTFEPGWLGSVEGEVANVDPALILRSARLSAVVFDAAGNVIGGGNGMVFAPLPPNSREFFKLTNGFRSIPFDQAASVAVSIQPSWQQPGT